MIWWHGYNTAFIFSQTCHRLSTGHVLGPCLYRDEPPEVSLCVFPRKGFWWWPREAVLLTGQSETYFLSYIVVPAGFSLLHKRNEIHGRASGVWVRHDLRWQIHWTAVANERKKKVIQILYIRLWYSTIQYELIAHKKVKWSLIPDAATED